jgi:hypothetical protein
LDLFEFVGVAKFCEGEFAFDGDEGVVEVFAALAEGLGDKSLTWLASTG